MATTAGYHIWSMFDGVKDFREQDGSGGQDIEIEVVGHRVDSGLPQHVKDAEHVEVYINRGRGAFSFTVEGDPGRVCPLSLEAKSEAATYNSGVKYNDGSKYATTGEATVSSGLEMNTEGRSLRGKFRGFFDSAIEIGGWAIDAFVLPFRRMS